MLIVALFLFILLFWGAVTVVMRLRPMSVLGAMPLAFCVLIALETVVLNVLSIFHLVTFYGVLYSHILILSCWLIWLLRFCQVPGRPLKRLLFAIKFLSRQPAIMALSPVILLLVFMLLYHPPNTWDSMTYHMARVVHWMQNQSIDYYYTGIDRQNEMGPGAEYLILFFQILTNTDYLATSVQFFAYVLLPGAFFYLLRSFKVARLYQSPIILLTVTAPMFLFQATTTQNDLIASLVAVAIVISSLRVFCGIPENFKQSEFFLFGVCLAVGFLVKPTSILVTLPLIGLTSALRIRELFLNKGVMLSGLAITTIVLVIIAGPDIYRKVSYDVDRHEVYEIDSNWNQSRLLNPIAITFQSIPWPKKVEGLYRELGVKEKLYSNIFRLHNSFVGNPIQLLWFFLASSFTIILLPLLFVRREKLLIHCISLAPILSWIAFGFMIKNNPWITRVQLPLFAILPLSFVFLSRISFPRNISKKFFHFLLVFSAIFSLMFAFFTLSQSEHRSMKAENFFDWNPIKQNNYYTNRNKIFKEHNTVINGVKNENCLRLGLYLGRNDYDYPLSWRLVQEGRQAHHISDIKSDDWSCMAYVNRSEVLEEIAEDNQWVQYGQPFLWIRNKSVVFEKSKSCGDMHDDDVLTRISIIQNAHISNFDGVEVEITGEDPQIALPNEPCTDARSTILKVLIHSPIKSTAKLYYMTDTERNYSERRAITQPLSPGMNECYFLLPADILYGDLRLDVEAESGVFQIRSVEMRGI